jgi:hypothetical protein
MNVRRFITAVILAAGVASLSVAPRVRTQPFGALAQ